MPHWSPYEHLLSLILSFYKIHMHHIFCCCLAMCFLESKVEPYRHFKSKISLLLFDQDQIIYHLDRNMNNRGHFICVVYSSGYIESVLSNSYRELHITIAVINKTKHIHLKDMHFHLTVIF